MLTFKKPRCVLVYCLAPETLSPAAANEHFNDFVADQQLPLVIFHDHFIGHPGGLALFFVEDDNQREALAQYEGLSDWQIEMHPLIFSRSPSAFDEQISFTLSTYRDADWEQLRHEHRPSYGDPIKEADSAQES